MSIRHAGCHSRTMSWSSTQHHLHHYLEHHSLHSRNYARWTATFPIRDINVTLSWSTSPGSYEQRSCIRERCRKPSNALMFCMLETIRTPVLVLIFTVLGRQQTEGKGESSMRSSLYQWQFASIIIKIQGITESFHENLWSKYAIF